VIVLLASLAASLPASASMPAESPYGPSWFGPGPLNCDGTTYIITERGFGADIQVVGSTTLLIWRAYGPEPPANPAPGLRLVHCTGQIPDSLRNVDTFDLWVSIVPAAQR
jgi:hypothetical protein